MSFVTSQSSVAYPGRVPVKASELPQATPFTGGERVMVLQNGILKTGLSTDLTGVPQQASALQVATAAPVTAGMVATTDVLGRVIPANANSITTARVVGLCDKTVGSGVGVGIAKDFLHLQDWTPIVGMPFLVPNADYFLSDTVSGALTATPPTTPGSYVLRVGTAVNEETMSVIIGVPIKQN